MQGKKPHIIIFNPDQMRADSLGHLGNPAAQTPFLDGFAQTEAVSFRHAFCQNPVCVPSRCSFTTGLYPHVRGHRTMAHLLRPGEESLFSQLKAAGYYVWMNGRNDLLAGQHAQLVQAHAHEVFYGGQTPPPPGPERQLWSGPEQCGYYSMYQGRLGCNPATGLCYGGDDEDLDAAIRRIQNPVDDRPLCLFLGLMNPHPPYAVEEPYFSAIRRRALPPRVQPAASGKPKLHALLRQRQNLQTLPEQTWDELRACYLGMCLKVDGLFARLCTTLKEAGIYEDSAIFFFSDHGDYTGDHGLVEKAQNTFEDCLVNVPLLVKPPKGMPCEPGITESLAELVDFYATALDFAGVPSAHTHFGQSLRPVLQNRQTTLRDFVCCEGGRLAGERHADEFHALANIQQGDAYWPRLSAQTDEVAHGKATMLRTRRCKYVARAYEQDEFYDLEQDPGERYNRIDDPACAGLVLQHKELLLRWYQQTCDIVPETLDARATEAGVWARVERYIPPGQEAQVRQKLKNGANQDELIRYCAALKADKA